MRFFRCKCGKYEIWGGPPANCQTCDECQTVPAEGPDSHPTPVPHDWVCKIVTENGVESDQSYCLRCLQRKT